MADFSPLYVRFALIATELMRRSDFDWHQPSVVAKQCEFAAEMVCADAGLHADET